MITFKNYHIHLKALQSLYLIAILAFISGCGATQHSRSLTPDTLLPGMVVVGVVAKTGLKAAVDPSRMSTDLAALLAGTGELSVTPSSVTRQIIGAGPHDEMLAFYARHGRYAPYQVQRMMAANLPYHRALSVRLESDVIERLPVLRQEVVNATGLLVAERERRVYRTRRTTFLSATLMDLRNGRIVWTKRYKVTPENEYAINHHTGGSFSASLAAAMANTMVHGLDNRRHPEPPGLTASVLALLQEVAYNVPVK